MSGNTPDPVLLGNFLAAVREWDRKQAPPRPSPNSKNEFGEGEEETTQKVKISPEAMQSELDLAYADLKAAVQVRDLGAVDAARIRIGLLQRDQREARFLLLARVSDQMKRDIV